MTLAAPFVLAGVAGLLLGSFLNVVAHRLPRGASLVRPRSACPACATPVRPYDNVPVLSWLLLRGRCRDCDTRIAARYPLVEAGTAVLLAAVVAVHLGSTTPLVLGVVLAAFLVPMALIDLDHQIIPNKLTAPAAVVALGLGIALDPSGQPERLIAGVAAAAFLLLAALMRPGGMGMGDVKLAGVLGLFLGGEVAVALLVALLSGTLVGGVVMARVGVAAGRKTKVPFGPFLALGGVVAVLAGTPLLDAYLGTFA
jgi:leader peptidase (prepilin peptidase) / N-methyltransferase